MSNDSKTINKKAMMDDIFNAYYATQKGNQSYSICWHPELTEEAKKMVIKDCLKHEFVSLFSSLYCKYCGEEESNFKLNNNQTVDSVLLFIELRDLNQTKGEEK